MLLKAVAMAVHVYAMSCFRLPKATCVALTSALSHFWWSSMEYKRKIHWIAWKKLGGLRFRDIGSFNQALLAKEAWRLLHVLNRLFSRFIKSIYFNDEGFLKAELGLRPSFAWKSILHGRKLLELGLKQMVGNGRSLRVWIDPWMGIDRRRVPLMKNISINIDLLVVDLIDQLSRS